MFIYSFFFFWWTSVTTESITYMVPGYIMARFKNLAIWPPDWRPPFEYRTSLSFGSPVYLETHFIPTNRNKKCKSLLSDGTKSNETMWKCTEEIVQVKEQVVFLPSNSLKVICIDGKQKRLVLRLLYMDHIYKAFLEWQPCLFLYGSVTVCQAIVLANIPL